MMWTPDPHYRNSNLCAGARIVLRVYGWRNGGAL